MVEAQTHAVSGYVRRKPADPNADAYERTHARLREEVALMELERGIAEIVRREMEANWLWKEWG